jgi:hypothetical protein
MENESFTRSYLVEQSPEAVFAAVNDVRAWWSGDIEGRTDALGAEFTYSYGTFHASKQKIMTLEDERAHAAEALQAMARLIEGRAEYGADLRRQGKLRDAWRLRPSKEGKRVRRGERRATFDGPFLESKEVIGGLFFLPRRTTPKGYYSKAAFAASAHEASSLFGTARCCTCPCSNRDPRNTPN